MLSSSSVIMVLDSVSDLTNHLVDRLPGGFAFGQVVSALQMRVRVAIFDPGSLTGRHHDLVEVPCSSVLKFVDLTDKICRPRNRANT